MHNQAHSSHGTPTVPPLGRCSVPGCGGLLDYTDDSYSGDSAIRNNQFMQLRDWEDTQDLVEWATGMRPRGLEEMSDSEALEGVAAIGALPWKGLFFDEEDDVEHNRWRE